jgi:hypothetical protein
MITIGIRMRFIEIWIKLYENKVNIYSHILHLHRHNEILKELNFHEISRKKRIDLMI